jgi:4-aminobutyrate aminotransferase-like enzyme/Ser/Thr protein kinase RdoA (MazF antagonist)
MSASEILAAPPPAFSEGDAVELAARHFGLDVSATCLVSERDQNFKLQAADGKQCLLKVANAAENAEAIDFENAALAHIARVAPNLQVPRVLMTVKGEHAASYQHNGDVHWVRIISWLSGHSLRDIETTEPLRRQLGSNLALLGQALRGFFHPGGGKQLLWDIRHTANLERWLEHVEDETTRTLCGEFIAYFGAKVLPSLEGLRSQVIHNDLNASNVLVSDEKHPVVSGIVDFGDMVHGPLVCDVAVAAAYQLGTGPDPLTDAISFIEAYHRVSPLTPDELALLFDLTRARLVTTLIVTSWRASRYSDNRDYILRNAHVAASQLGSLTELGVDRATDQILRACTPVQPPRPSAHGREDSILLQRRQELLGSAYRLFYERPLHAVRGEGVWLYDAEGKAYLDAYNNVPLVGHCHPGVVSALSSQAATLNSHTRYLHQTVVDYAERLLKMFPAELDKVMFGCTGSEANELALRLARAFTGNEGVIVSEYAYHGNTTAIAQLSPSYASPDPQAKWVETIPPPNAYRCPTGSDDEAVSTEFLANLDAAIERLKDRGIRPAALLLDAGFTSDGMYVAPPGCLASAAERIRKAGGVYIADEVQAGFARFGEALWGFELHDVAPDIVTLGKPIGNGHPLSATIVRSEILDIFSSHGRYFNTFGGNPVAAATGLAVLDVFENEALARNSHRVGAYLQTKLNALKARFDLIGDVRGSGLFAGVELVTDRATKEHATIRTGQIVNDLRENGVLISMIGPTNNVLKIRPPLPFETKHVDLLIEKLIEALP